MIRSINPLTQIRSLHENCIQAKFHSNWNYGRNQIAHTLRKSSSDLSNSGPNFCRSKIRSARGKFTVEPFELYKWAHWWIYRHGEEICLISCVRGYSLITVVLVRNSSRSFGPKLDLLWKNNFNLLQPISFTMCVVGV